MSFVPHIFAHRERLKKANVTHIRLLPGVKADTAPAQRVLDHIKRFVDENDLAEIESVLPEFPAIHKNIGMPKAALTDLRHMANLRGSGDSEKDKGLRNL